jgi:hypothetical protein
VYFSIQSNRGTEICLAPRNGLITCFGVACGKYEMNEWSEWIRTHPTALWWLATASVLMFIASLILVPVVVGRIPNNYFAHERRPPSAWANEHLALRAIVLFVKNAAGILLILMGIAMLVLPGQGILTVIVGIMLLDFPGKFRLERWLISRRPTLRSINWLRRRANREPLIVDE